MALEARLRGFKVSGDPVVCTSSVAVAVARDLHVEETRGNLRRLSGDSHQRRYVEVALGQSGFGFALRLRRFYMVDVYGGLVREDG